ncbi:DUF4276 family protein [Paenibacillus sp. VCA1]|uniref:DUF4276 family protein n=1 Tax=Paenibacillus sp. VCA1 TaxID=3039148 RepID=UPI0028712FE9|nr:DUF4276 family protein [Paenibacillus sp. VCA1]MDR9853624.1 DUF4276 family protein [Paenibacillus sp. VCA1]
MHLEVLVEEPSMKKALDILIPKIIDSNHSFEVHNFRSKQDLMSKLEQRLRGYSKLRSSWEFKIVILIDEDRQNCRELKQFLVNVANKSGVADISLCRIVVEELEAWFFGDIPAIRAVYPRIPESLGEQIRFRNPDQIPGGTWEALDKVLIQYGYRKGLVKTEAAAKIAQHMDPWNNKSISFQFFRDGIINLVR